MKRATDRRTVLIAAATAVARPVAAQSSELRGIVIFEGDKAVPEGQLEIVLEDPAIADKTKRRSATTRLQSDGTSHSLAFALAVPAGLAGSPTRQIVARLERADGWLLARGSASLGAGLPAQVVLSAVLY
jgi:uncharacterized lipoprotein YbaY